MNSVEITKDEAIAAVAAAAWSEQPKPEAATCGHPGCIDHAGEGQKMIHCMSGFGMDLPLDHVVAEIEACQKVGWVDHPLRHDLAVLTADGRAHYYEVRRPADVLAGQPQ